MSKYTPSYKWNLSDLEKVEKNGLKVFSCFACGGGSTMGYKLAGFDVIGANDIDPDMAWHYKTNHNPKYYFLEDIRKFAKREDYPKELYNLDILDGSPPCSSFSMAGARSKDWGKKKVFREGQTAQVLDDLFFDFIELARKLRPKVVVAENVKGLIQGHAKGYVKQIISLFDLAGYNVQLFLLNAATMGVPQKRERVFFIAHRKDLSKPKLKVGFSQKPIPLKDAFKGSPLVREYLTDNQRILWEKCLPGRAFSTVHAKGSCFGQSKANPNDVCPTLTTKSDSVFHWSEKRMLSDYEWKICGSYPQDYVFRKSPKYFIGMSVPPLMTYGIANQIYQQWFSKEAMLESTGEKRNGLANKISKSGKDK